jgi:YD repeat-containing protein
MKCTACGFEFSDSQPTCPRCGSYLGPTTTPSQGFRYILVCIGIAAVLCAAAGAYLSHRVITRQDPWAFLRKFPAPGQASRYGPVAHGGVVKPGELQSQGKLYFVPMGSQAFSAESLAAYYREKFQIEVTVLPEVPIGPTDYDPSRKQYVAEEMILDMKRACPKIAHDPASAIIVLTDEDIYGRSLGWQFTYSYHSGYKYAVISSHRNDPAFWDASKPHDPVEQLAGFKQMLTKYVALLYFHLPHSLDPTSIMYQPLTPNGGSDDLYESDLHSEESANGLRLVNWPCLIHSYSYKTGTIEPLAPFVQECGRYPLPSSPDQEILLTELATGEFIEDSMDFQLDSAPPIDFLRTYRSQWVDPKVLGRGTTHIYNPWLYSSDAVKLPSIEVVNEYTGNETFKRNSPGSGLSPGVVFSDDSDSNEAYGARMLPGDGILKIQYRDGSWFTFPACTNGPCFLSGYQDATGHELHFDRDAAGDLHRLTSSDNQSIALELGDQHRLASAQDSNGSKVIYQYDVPGRLISVTRPDGQVTQYVYDIYHRMTRMSVIHHPGDAPVLIVANDYDAAGRLSRQTFGDGSVVQLSYIASSNKQITQIKLIEPGGRVLEITRTSDGEYIGRTTPVRFPRVSWPPQAPAHRAAVQQ